MFRCWDIGILSFASIKNTLKLQTSISPQRKMIETWFKNWQAQLIILSVWISLYAPRALITANTVYGLLHLRHIQTGVGWGKGHRNLHSIRERNIFHTNLPIWPKWTSYPWILILIAQLAKIIVWWVEILMVRKQARGTCFNIKYVSNLVSETRNYTLSSIVSLLLSQSVIILGTLIICRPL